MTVRAVWVDAFGEGLRSPAEVAEVVDFARDAGLNTLVVQATRRGDAFADLPGLPRADAELAPRPFDPIAEVCAQAHRAQIAVHAWISVTPAGRDTVADDLLPWLSRRVDGDDRCHLGLAHLDPGLPAVRTHVAGLAAALAQRYPLDGVSLDRVRYPEDPAAGTATWGYRPEAVARFTREAGPRTAPAPAPAPAPDDQGWQDWRRRQVTALVDEVVATGKAVRTEVEVSVNACTFGGVETGWSSSRPYVELGQDWVSWLRTGRLDRVLLMNYRGDTDDTYLEGDPDPLRYRRRFDDWARLACDADAPRTVLGLGWYLRSVEDSVEDTRRAAGASSAGPRAGGWSGFSYRTPSRAVLDGEAAAADERAALAAGLRGI